MSELTRLLQARSLGHSGRGRALRLATGLSLREVAEEIEVDAATLQRWEHGVTRPRREAALRWLDVLQTISSSEPSGHDWSEPAAAEPRS